MTDLGPSAAPRRRFRCPGCWVALGLIGLASLGVWSVLRVPRDRTPSPGASIAFLGFTNLATGTNVLHAIFSLTNPSPRAILTLPVFIDRRAATGWVAAAEVPNFTQWRGFRAGRLESHQELLFLVPVPASADLRPWRLRFQCSEHRGAIDTVRDWWRNPPWRHRGNLTRFYRGRRYDVVGPELSLAQTERPTQVQVVPSSAPPP